MKFSPHVVQAVDFFARVSCLVASEVLRGRTAEARAIVMDKWMRVACILNKARSFQALAG